MSDKPSRNEEEYFAKREAELLESRRQSAQSTAEIAARKSHYMKCPKCGADLVPEDHEGVEVDRCPECQGVWFDAGEAESLVQKQQGGITSIFKSIIRGVRSR